MAEYQQYFAGIMDYSEQPYYSDPVGDIMRYKSWIFIGILCVTGVLFLIGKHLKNKPQTNPLTFPWSDLRKDYLLGIESVLYQENKKFPYKLLREQNTWHLEEPLQIDALPEKAILLANTFLTAKPLEKITDISAEDYNAYGFSEPRLEVQAIIKNNTNQGFIVGTETRVGNNFYIMLLDQTNTAYIISGSSLEPFFAGAPALINNNIFTESSDSVREIKFRNFDGKENFFIKKDNFWVQIFPENNTEKDWGLRQFILHAKNLYFYPQSIIFSASPQQLQQAGINTNTSPYLTLIFEDRTSSVFLGSKQENGYAAYIPTLNILAEIPTDIADTVFHIDSNDFRIRQN